MWASSPTRWRFLSSVWGSTCRSTHGRRLPATERCDRDMPSSDDTWHDEEAGPVVRPYALIHGRTRPSGERLDLIAMVISSRRAPRDPWTLDPEHFSILRMSRIPISVADVASELDLPLGVVRILLAGLRVRGLVTARPPLPPADLEAARVLEARAVGVGGLGRPGRP